VDSTGLGLFSWSTLVASQSRFYRDSSRLIITFWTRRGFFATDGGIRCCSLLRAFASFCSCCFARCCCWIRSVWQLLCSRRAEIILVHGFLLFSMISSFRNRCIVCCVWLGRNCQSVWFCWSLVLWLCVWGVLLCVCVCVCLFVCALFLGVDYSFL
jgi:hypothetical protein